MKSIIIKEEIKLDYNKQTKTIIIYQRDHLEKLMGATSIASNLRLYNIKKKKYNQWEIPLKTLQERERVIRERIDKNIVTMNLLRQVTRQTR